MDNQKEFFLANLLYDVIDSADIDGVKVILKKGANPNYLIPEKTITPFHLAVGMTPLQFSIEVTKIILQNGGNPNVKSEDEYTPLHVATYLNRFESVKLLVSHGANPEIMDSVLKTPVDYANEENNARVTTFFNRIIIANIVSYKNRMNYSYNYKLDKIILRQGSEIMEMKFHTKHDYNIVPLTNESANQILPIQEVPNKEEISNINNNKETLKINTIDSSSGFSSASDKPDVRYKSNSKSNQSNKPPVTDLEIEEALNTAMREMPLPSSESGVFCVKTDVPSQTDSYYTCSDHADCAGCSRVERRKNEIVEVRKFEDKSENVVFFERRVSSVASNEAKAGGSNSSREQDQKPDHGSSLTTNASTTELREALTTFGYQSGPITLTTKPLYVKKLRELKRHYKHNKNAYSKPLEKSLERPLSNAEINESNRLEALLISQFSRPDVTKRWREGTRKSSFNYLLLDPRITLNLPERHKNLNENETWRIFIESIFYVGKGKKVRPYDHLYAAIKYYNRQEKSTDKKIQHIIDIWNGHMGVVCLHVFHNSIPVEAYTREAAMISAINLKNLKNVKNGEFYGPAVSWSEKERNLYGTFLLHKCMNIYLLEGEKQIMPNDF